MRQHQLQGANPAVFGNGHVALGHSALDFHSAAHGIDRTGELDQSAVTGCLDDAAATLGNLGINELAPVRLERCESLVPQEWQPAAIRHVPRP